MWWFFSLMLWEGDFQTFWEKKKIVEGILFESLVKFCFQIIEKMNKTLLFFFLLTTHCHPCNWHNFLASVTYSTCWSLKWQSKHTTLCKTMLFILELSFHLKQKKPLRTEHRKVYHPFINHFIIEYVLLKVIALSCLPWLPL